MTGVTRYIGKFREVSPRLLVGSPRMNTGENSNVTTRVWLVSYRFMGAMLDVPMALWTAIYGLQWRDVHFASPGRERGSGTLALGTDIPPTERLVRWGEDQIKVSGCCPRPARKTLASKGNPECLDL